VHIFIIVWLNKKVILIDKFSKYNQVNILSCKIKYLDLHLAFDFSSFILSYRLWFFLFNTHGFQFIILLVCINFFYFRLEFFQPQKYIKKPIYIIVFWKKKIDHKKARVKYLVVIYMKNEYFFPFTIQIGHFLVYFQWN
jgi:hypothetical protein